MNQQLTLFVIIFITALQWSNSWIIVSARDKVKKPFALFSFEGETLVEAELHGYEVTTKTKKKLVFDQQAGRFFEKTDDATFFEIPAPTFAADHENVIESTDFSNEMVPTQILFGEGGAFTSQIPSNHTTIERKSSDDKDPEEFTDMISYLIPAPIVETVSIVEECYKAWNRRDMMKVVGCFAGKFEYQDSQYLGSFTNKRELMRHFSTQADLLPAESQIVVDNIAVCRDTGNIGTEWHVERKTDGTTVPFTRGCSFYTTNEQGLITSGFRTSEMLVKPSKQAANRLVSSASRVMQNSNNSAMNSYGNPTNTSPSKSIIERYFDAWNIRDMESALACFTDDCIYQTEDPVFVDTFQGKEALREHLAKNAKSLPASCRIILDSIAADPSNGNIGTRWHLEVNGMQIPNLRGCSMYTTTETGLLKSGFDVTEAPVKLPSESTNLLSLPAKLLFGA